MADIKDDFHFKRLVKLLDKLPPERQQALIKELELKASQELQARAAYSPKEFAMLTGVAENTVRRWLRGGYLRGTKIGRKWLIPHAEVEKIREGAYLPPPENRGPPGT